jgi:hypothetical protein
LSKTIVDSEMLRGWAVRVCQVTVVPTVFMLASGAFSATVTATW